MADVFEVVVFAADAHTLLRCRRGGVRGLELAEEKIFELVHPRIVEEEGRIVVGDDRRGVDEAVASLSKKREEFTP